MAVLVTKGKAMATKTEDKPCAAKGLRSYRYKGRFGWVMIGASDTNDALREAARSVGELATNDRLQVWDGTSYVWNQ